MTVPDGFGLCVFDEQGAGKTVTLIFAFDVLMARDEIDFCLIVAPKSMILEWSLDFERFRGGLYQVVVASGSRSEKRLALRKTADVVVTNFETAVSMEADLRSLLRQHGDRAIMVIDESFYVKNLNARRTRSLRRLRSGADGHSCCAGHLHRTPHMTLSNSSHWWISGVRSRGSPSPRIVRPQGQ